MHLKKYSAMFKTFLPEVVRGFVTLLVCWGVGFAAQLSEKNSMASKMKIKTAFSI